MKRPFNNCRLLIIYFVMGWTGLVNSQSSLLCKLAQAPHLSKTAPDAEEIYATAAVEQILAGIGTVSGHKIFTIVDGQSPIAGELEKWIRLDFADLGDRDQAYQKLVQINDVEYVGPVRAFKLDFVPNDPRFGDQWALGKIAAREAWDIERGRPDILVAVIDTGIDYRHPDLAANLWLNSGEDLNGNGAFDENDLNNADDDGNGFIDDVIGWDFTDAPNYPDGGDYLEPDNDPMDEQGHGTGVAGIIAASTDNGLGVAGVAHKCRVMNLRAFTAGGNGEEDDVASAILYAINNGARIINMSWGDVFVSRIIDDVVRYAATKGIVLIASAGNASTDQVHYPSAFEGTISVGSTTAEDKLSSFSNFGPTVDLVAPGSDILTTGLNSGYTSLNGTSFAAPFVSGAAALLLAQHPEFGADVVRANLLKSATDLGAAGWDDQFAAGRLNLASLLTNPLYSIVEIKKPFLDQGLSQGPLEIWGSAWSPTLEYFEISYGPGDNPENWTFIGRGANPVLDGLLYRWDGLPADGSYTMRLLVANRDGSVDLDFVRFFVDSSEPVISNVQLLPMLDRDRHSVLITFNTDDLCEGSVHFRPASTGVDFNEALFSFRTNQQKFNLTQNHMDGVLELKLEAWNRSGLHSIDDNDGRLYSVDLSAPPLDVTSFSPRGNPVTPGILLPKSYDFDGNGLPEIIVGSRQNGSVSIVRFFESTPDGLTQVFAMNNALIPRDIGDSDGDGKWEILCGYGFNSYLYEAPEIGSFPTELIKEWTGDGGKQYWASRITDLDNDGLGEIVMRTVGISGEGKDLFALYEWDGSSDYRLSAQLPNPTEGENQNGVPKSVVGDFDGDGLKEILLGDSDGDLYIYENRGNDNFAVTWQHRMPLLDTIDYLATGDFDGDRVLEFAAGCHTDPNLNTEHEYDARHWLYRVFDQAQDDNYQSVYELRLFGFESPKDFESGVSAGDIDLDGDDELFVAAFPDFYLLDYSSGEYGVIYYHENVQSNGAVVLDGENEFFLAKTDGIYKFQAVASNTAPAVPTGIEARPLDAGHVKLTWRAVEGAQQYIVQRGTSETNMINYETTTVPELIDDKVKQGIYYYYSVAAIDPGKSPSVSVPSRIVRALPGPRPKLIRAVGESEHNVRLYFDKPMNSTVKNSSLYRISPAIGRPTSAALDASNLQVVLTVPETFNVGTVYTISCSTLEDAYGTPLDTTASSTTFSIQKAQSIPYLVKGRILGDSRLELVFSEPMDLDGLLNGENYTVNGGTAISAITAANENSMVVLELDGKGNFGALGRPVTIRVSNLVSANGVSMQRGRGDFLQLIFSQTNLDNVFTFPNPFRPGSGADFITFANLTRQADIEIFTSQGIKVRTLREDNGDGGLQWDSTNESGVPVASGIYIYRIRSGSQTVYGKLAIVR